MRAGSVWGEVKAVFDRDQSAAVSPEEKGTPPWGSGREPPARGCGPSRGPPSLPTPSGLIKGGQITAPGSKIGGVGGGGGRQRGKGRWRATLAFPELLVLKI